MKKKFAAAALAGTMVIGLVASFGSLVANAGGGTAFLVNGVAGATYVAQAARVTQSTNLAQNGVLSSTVIVLQSAGTTIKSVAITGTNPGDFTVNSTCPAGTAFTSNASGVANCSFTVNFAPTGTGLRTAIYTIAFSSGGSAVLNLQGNALSSPTAPAAFVAPIVQGGNTSVTSIPFVPTTLGATTPVTLVVGNSGQGDLTLGLAVTGANASDFTANFASANCSPVVSTAGGGTGLCNIGLLFKPTAAGARSATLTITTNDPANPSYAVALSGTAVGPIFGVSTAPVTFADTQVGVPNAQATSAVSIQNTGAGALSLSFAFTGPNAADFSAVTTPSCASVAAGATCTQVIKFVPKIVGPESATLVVTTNDPATPTASIPLSGNGISALPSLVMSTATMTFPDTQVGVPNSSSSNSRGIGNNGPGNLTVSFAIVGPNASDFSLTGTVCSFIAGAAFETGCTQPVKFIPTILGPESATLVVTTNDPLHPSASIPLAGNGIPPQSSLTLSLGVVNTSNAWISQTTQNGSTTTLYQDGTSPVSTIVNSGAGDDTITGISYQILAGLTPVNGVFTLGGQCGVVGAVVPAGGSCPFTITFAPQFDPNQVTNISYNGPVKITFASGKALIFIANGVGTLAPVPPSPGAIVVPTVSPVFPNTNEGAPICNVIPGGGFPPRVPIFTTSPPNCWYPSLSPTVTLKNTGGSPVNILSATTTGPDAADFHIGAQCFSVPVGPTQGVAGSCTTLVIFEPTFQTYSARNASLVLTTDDAANPTVSIPLSATALLIPVVSQFDASGVWVIPTQPNFSMILVHHKTTTDQIVGYLNDGTNVGLRLDSGVWTLPNIYTGNVRSIDPATGTEQIVGTFTFTLTSSTTGTITYTVNGTSFTRNVASMVF